MKFYKVLIVLFMYCLVLTLGFISYMTRLNPETVDVNHIETICMHLPSHNYVHCIYNTTKGVYKDTFNRLRCECPNKTKLEIVNKMTYKEYNDTLILVFSIILFLIVPGYTFVIYYLEPNIFQFVNV